MGDHTNLSRTLLRGGLTQRINRNTVLSQDAGNVRQNAQAILRHNTHRVARHHVIQAGCVQLRVRSLRNTGTTQHQTTSQRHEVTQNSRSSRSATRAGTVEHQLASVLRLNEHSVERTVHARQRVLTRNQGRVHANVRAVLTLALANSQQLDDVTISIRGSNIISGDGSNALGMHIINGESRVERQRSNNRSLRRGVVALNVSSRVSLRVAELLSLSQCVREGCAGGVHLVKNVVGGAVHDAQNAGHAVTSQGVTQGAQNRDSTRNSSLVGELSAGLISGSLQLHTVLSQQRLVTGDHRLTRLQSTQNASASRLNTAGQLDDHIRRINQGFSVGGVQRGVRIPVAGCISIAHSNTDQLHGRANALFKDGVILHQDASSLGTDITGTKQCYFDLFSHDSLFLRSVPGSPRYLFGLRHGCGAEHAPNNHFIKRRRRGCSLKVRLLLSEMRYPSQL